MHGLLRPFALALALLTVGAAPNAKYIPLNKYSEAILVPAQSPVSFQRFDRYDRAHFRGTFVLEGTFVLNCEYCERGVKDNQLHLSMIPDPGIAARLPRWNKRGSVNDIDITGAERFIRSITTPRERKKMIALETDEIKGRASLIVDQFEAGLDCDSANYSAHFVAISRPTKRDNRRPGSDVGC